MQGHAIKIHKQIQYKVTQKWWWIINILNFLKQISIWSDIRQTFTGLCIFSVFLVKIYQLNLTLIINFWKRMYRINQRFKTNIAYALVAELCFCYRLLLQVVMSSSYVVNVTICIRGWNVLSVRRRISVNASLWIKHFIYSF